MMISKIVFFIQNYGRPAGSERATSIVANQLSERGYEVAILSICGHNKAYYSTKENIKLYTLIEKDDVNNRKEFFTVLRKLKNFYKKNAFDLCIDVMPSLSIYTTLVKKKFDLKNITWEHFNFNVNTGMCWYGRKFAMRFSNYIVTLTAQDMQLYRDSGKLKTNIQYIYNPTPYPDSMMHYQDKKTIISIGRLNYQKGFERLVEVWKLVEPHTDWELKIFGQGEDYDKLSELIAYYKLRHIHIMPPTPHIDNEYMNSSIYVSTARYEGLPMTMIEAQSFGIPIISWDYDTGPRDIIVDGINGYLINHSNEEEMIRNTATIILDLVNNPEKINELSYESQKSSEKYKICSVMDKWLDILREI